MNLTGDHQKKLMEHPTGRQIYVNALSAYLICQQWGNQPQAVPQTVLDRVQRLANNPSQENHEKLTGLWSQYWGYELEQIPPVVVLDTRTQRQQGRHLALMNDRQLRSLGNRVSKLPDCSTILLVSPTPLYGFTKVEVTQMGRVGTALNTTLDREPWLCNKSAMNKLERALQKIGGLSDIVIFSGDVHYGFSRRCVKDDTGITLWQFCSSAACNSPVGGSFGMNVLRRLIGMKEFFKKKTPYLVPIGDGNEIVICDENIGTLDLSDQLKPIGASLICQKKG